MTNEKLLQGNLELILLTILQGGEMYGLEIIEEANSRTGGYFDFKEGSLYPALHRMTQAKWLTAEFRPSNKGGPRRRYYQISEKGQQVLAQKQAEWARFNQAIEALNGGVP